MRVQSERPKIVQATESNSRLLEPRREFLEIVSADRVGDSGIDDVPVLHSADILSKAWIVCEFGASKGRSAE
jgi:hypothetical protein